MSTFSSILSSINDHPQAQQKPRTDQRPKTSAHETTRPSSLANDIGLKSASTVAGVKRKSEEPDVDPRAKAAKLEKDGVSIHKAPAAAQSRFQLSAKSTAQQKLAGVPHRPSPNRTTSSDAHNPITKTVAKPNDTKATSLAAPQKRGFASIMEKAKAAQEAAKAAGPNIIKHKPVEKMTKRERQRLAEEAKAQQAAAVKSRKLMKRERTDTGDGASSQQKIQEPNYKGTMKKPPEPLSYKGTMRAHESGESKAKKQKGQAEDKYGGYASWSDLDDAEDEEENYDSEGSSDMEGGFDEVEREEVSATRAARKEDLEFLEEEERLKREKLERKRKLQELSKSAAARKKY